MFQTLFTAGSLIAPGAGLISSGYVAGNTLAAQNLNWYLKHISGELNSILSAAGIAPNANDDTQVRKAIFGEQYTPITGYTPAIGDVVALNYDGTIRKAKRFNVTLGALPAASQSGQTLLRVAPIDATHFVAVWWKGTVTAQIQAAVVTVDPNALGVTLGATAVVVNAATQPCWDVCTLTSTLALVVYSNGAGASPLSVVTLSISGTTITVNAPIAGAATTSVPGIVAVSATSAVIAYLTTTTNLQAAVVTVSGTVPTINTAANATVTTTNVSVNTYCTPIALEPGGGAVYVASVAGTANFDICRMALSGTTLTPGTVLNTGFNTTGSCPGMAEWGRGASGNQFSGVALKVSANSATITPFASGLMNVHRRATAGTLFTLGSTVFGLLHMDAVSNAQHETMKCIDQAGGVYVVASFTNEEGGGSGGSPYVVVVKREAGGGANSNNIWRTGEPVRLINGVDIAQAQDQIGVCALSSGLIIAGIPSSSGANASGSIVVMSRANTILGIAIDTVGTVQRTGIVTGLTGLTPGVEYGADSNGNLTTVVGEVSLGVALSTTSLLLNVRRGI